MVDALLQLPLPEVFRHGDVFSGMRSVRRTTQPSQSRWPDLALEREAETSEGRRRSREKHDVQVRQRQGLLCLNQNCVGVLAPYPFAL